MTYKHLFLAAAFCGAVQGGTRDVVAADVRSGGWPVPKISEATFLKEVARDLLPELPGQETLLRIYRTREGTYFNSLTAKGRTYAYFVDTDGKPPMEYTLTDYSGDGVFSHRSSGEDMLTPGYLLEKEE